MHQSYGYEQGCQVQQDHNFRHAWACARAETWGGTTEHYSNPTKFMTRIVSVHTRIAHQKDICLHALSKG